MSTSSARRCGRCCAGFEQVTPYASTLRSDRLRQPGGTGRLRNGERAGRPNAPPARGELEGRMSDSSQPTRTSGAVSRRTVLKTGAAVAGAVAAPAIVSPRVLASSGEVNILMWSDYLPASFADSFTQKTGIKINF